MSLKYKMYAWDSLVMTDELQINEGFGMTSTFLVYLKITDIITQFSFD